MMGMTALPGSTAAEPEERSRPRVSQEAPEEYRADFADAERRGVGVRYEHRASGHYVDLRLRGYRGSSAQMRGRDATFSAEGGVRVLYEVLPLSVKETIVVDDREPSEFSFDLEAPGMVATPDGDRIVFSSGAHPSLFQLLPPRAWDALGNEIGASQRLEADRVILSLDPTALRTATPPITIDPTIQGAPLTAVPPYVRRLFRTSDGRLLFFGVEDIGGQKKVVYRLSSDGGQTWGAPVILTGTSASSGLAVTAFPGDNFGIAYTVGNSGTEQGAFRELVRQAGDVWGPGTERLVTTGSGTVSNPQVAYRGSGSLGRRLVVGFWGWNALLSKSEFVTNLSEDTGVTWTGLATCGGASWTNTIAVQSETPICTSVSPAGFLEWRSWDGLAWTQPQPLMLVKNGDAAPSWVQTADGTLHVVVSGLDQDGSPGVYYSRLPAGAGTWSPSRKIGSGQLPVLSTDGTGLRVHAEDLLSGVESVIRRYGSPDAEQWAALPQLDGGEFQYVLDYTSTWAFSSLPGDLLFNTRDASGSFGNLIGTANFLHVLDSEDKRLALSFVAPRNGSITGVKLWIYSSANPPTYRIGIQSDSAGVPSGHWLNEVLVGGIPVSGAFSDVAIPAGLAYAPLNVGLPTTAVQNALRYHVVIEAKHDPSPLGTNADATHWAAFETVGADTQGSTLGVFDKLGTGAWVSAQGEVPRFSVNEASQPLVVQELAQAAWLQASEYSLPAETFLNPTARTLDSVTVFLKRVGSPTQPITVRLLTESGTELWSQQLALQADGWVTASPVGVTLAAGQRYRLVLDSHETSMANSWFVQTSNGETTSWDGAASTAARAFDRPGYTDRSHQASETQPSITDLVAFNAATTDALYLGSGQPFDTVAVSRLYSDTWASPPVSASYWNGSAWASLASTVNTLGVFPTGRLSFTPPADWAGTTVDGKVSYWVRLTQPSGPVAMHVDRMTAYHSYSSPASAPSATGSVPVVFIRKDEPSGMVYLGDAGPLLLGGSNQSTHLNVAWCLQPKPATVLTTYVVGGDLGRFVGPSCPANLDPVTFTLGPLDPLEQRFLYSRMETTRGTDDRYFQLSRVQCSDQDAILASTNHLETFSLTNVLATVARNLVVAGPTGGSLNCELRARSIKLQQPLNPGYLSIVRTTNESVGSEWHTYVLAYGDNKVGADRVQVGNDLAINPGRTRVVFDRIWPIAAGAVSATIVGDLELTTCWGYCDTAANGNQPGSDVYLTLSASLLSAIDPLALCKPLKDGPYPDTITTSEHHYKFNRTLVIKMSDYFPPDSVPPDCTRWLSIKMSITVGDGGNPVELTNGGSISFAMNGMQ